jgi:hypothetical protein
MIKFIENTPLKDIKGKDCYPPCDSCYQVSKPTFQVKIPRVGHPIFTICHKCAEHFPLETNS